MGDMVRYLRTFFRAITMDDMVRDFQTLFPAITFADEGICSATCVISFIYMFCEMQGLVIVKLYLLPEKWPYMLYKWHVSLHL